MNGDGKVAGAHEFVDDAVNGGEELLKILCGAGFFGNAIESGAESFGTLALRDIAIYGVEGGGPAVDDKGGAGDRNVEQGSIFVAALGFESQAFGALQALHDPLRLGGPFWRKDQRINGLAQGLRGGVAEHALKLLVDAEYVETIVNDDERIGRALKNLFQELAAEAETFPGNKFFRILERGGVFLLGGPGERRGRRGSFGCDRWNERRWGSTLKRLTQVFGAGEFLGLRCAGDTTTHFEVPPSKLARGMVERGGVTRKLRW